MKTTQQITYTFELIDDDIRVAFAKHIKETTGIEITINPSKLNFSHTAIYDGKFELLIVTYTS